MKKHVVCYGMGKSQGEASLALFECICFFMERRDKMKNQIDMFDFNALVETNDVEMKKAAGRDGKGAIPESLWETYSAMANTVGGVIILGAEQVGEREFRPYHLDNAERMVQDLWNIVNDRKKISKNILNEESIQMISLPGVKE